MGEGRPCPFEPGVRLVPRLIGGEDDTGRGLVWHGHRLFAGRGRLQAGLQWWLGIGAAGEEVTVMCFVCVCVCDVGAVEVLRAPKNPWQLIGNAFWR